MEVGSVVQGQLTGRNDSSREGRAIDLYDALYDASSLLGNRLQKTAVRVRGGNTGHSGLE